MQAQSQGVATQQGMFSSFAAIFREEGVRGLYRVDKDLCKLQIALKCVE